MKKSIVLSVLVIASMAALSSCKKENVINNGNNESGTVLKAYYEDVTKTALTSGYQVRWTSDDAIIAFDYEGIPHISSETSVSEDGISAEFSFGESIECQYALFPANEEAVISESVISTVLPSTQYPVQGGFDPMANIALSETIGNTAKFYNAGTLLGFEIMNDDIKAIKIKSDKAFAGDCIVYMNEGHPVITSMEEEAGKLTLENDFVNGGFYYAVVFPDEYKGLEITFMRADGKIAKYTNPTTLDLTGGRNCINMIFAQEIPDNKWEEPQLVSVAFDFSAQEYNNQQDMGEKSPVTIDDNFSISFDKGAYAQNGPKYYYSGTSVRCYYGNLITVTGKTAMAKIELTSVAASKNVITTIPDGDGNEIGTYTDCKGDNDGTGTWTASDGDATKEITFTIGKVPGSTSTGGHRKLKAITIYYYEE